MNKIFLFFLIGCLAQTELSAVEKINTSRVITICDYCSMLRALPDSTGLYSDAMAADPEGCGIIRTETETGCDYKVVAGMEDQPMKGINQEQQEYYKHWLEQKELTSVLMFSGEHVKTGSEVEETKSEEEKNWDDSLRQKGDLGLTSSSRMEERSENAAAIEEPQQLVTELNPNKSSDGIATITDVEPTQRINHYFSLFSPGHYYERFHQARDQLKQAREESNTAVAYFDHTRKQWEVFKSLEAAKQLHETLQQELSAAYNEWRKSDVAFQQAEAALRATLHPQDPSLANLAPIAVAHAAEIKRTFQTYQALYFQAERAYQQYGFAQQTAAQHLVADGVDYSQLLEEATQRINRTAAELSRAEEAVRLIKFEKPSTSINIGKRAVQKSEAGCAIESKPIAATGQSHKNLAEAVDVGEHSYQDQETQISAEDLAAWEREAFLQKEDRWKSTFHRMVKELRASKYRAKEVMEATLPNQILHEMLSGNLLLGIVHEAAKEILAEHQATAKKRARKKVTEQRKKLEKKESKVATKIAAAATELDRIGEEAKLLSQRKENFCRYFIDFPGEKTSAQNALKMKEEAARNLRVIREQERAVMKQFCKEKMDSLQSGKVVETENRAENAKFIFERAGNILTQYAHGCYEWGRNTFQFLADQREIQAEAGKRAEAYFIAQERLPVEVPTIEYSLKTAEIAQQLYAVLLAKREREKATAEKKERDPSEPLGFFEQIPIFLKNKNLLRFMGSLVSGKVVDEARESDMRAYHYFQGLGKKDPWVSEFWEKSGEIEVILQQEREAKQTEIMARADSEEKGYQEFNQWLAAWPKRLEVESQEKEKERLRQERLAEEAKKQAALEEENRKRQQLENELLSDENRKNLLKKKGVKKKKR